jgi:hypothetical protein
MKQFFPIVVCILILIGIKGCSPRLDFKKQHISKKEYKRDTLFISDYSVCVSLSNSFHTLSLRNRQYDEKEFSIFFNKDSIFNHFTNALTLLNIPFKIRNSSNNFCDSALYVNWRMNIKKIDFEKIKKNNKNDGLTLVPIIYLDNHHRTNTYMTSGGVIGGGELKKQTILTVLVVIIDGEEIIYLSSGKHFGKEYEALDVKDTRTYIKQEHWDKLVELVMRDYIKRMK